MKIKRNYWLIFGTAFMLGIASYGIAGTYNPDAGFFLNLISIIDWIAASILYFFFGAVIGFLIDKARNKRLKYPEWFYATIAFIFLTIIVIAIVADRSKISTALILLFPLAYGIFFSSQTFAMILPTASMYWKVAYNIILTAIFIAWISLSMKKLNTARILLIILFLVFLIGFVGCAITLA